MMVGILRSVSTLVLTIVLGGSIARAGQAAGECGAPQYKVADKRTAGEHGAEVNLSISIDPKRVSLRSLFAIACQLRVDFPKASLMRVDIFNDHRAAKRDDPLPLGDPPPKRDDSPKYIASYYLNLAKHEEHLLLWGNVRDCISNIIIELPSKRLRSMCDY